MVPWVRDLGRDWLVSFLPFVVLNDVTQGYAVQGSVARTDTRLDTVGTVGQCLHRAQGRNPCGTRWQCTQPLVTYPQKPQSLTVFTGPPSHPDEIGRGSEVPHPSGRPVRSLAVGVKSPRSHRAWVSIPPLPMTNQSMILGR